MVRVSLVRGAGTSFNVRVLRHQEYRRNPAVPAAPVRRARLRECAEALLAVKGLSAAEIMGIPDDLK